MNDWEMNALHTLALTRGKVETILCPVCTWVGLESTGGEKTEGYMAQGHHSSNIMVMGWGQIRDGMGGRWEGETKQI